MEPRRPEHGETTASGDHLQPVELQSVSETQIEGTLVHFQYDIKAVFPTYPRWIPKNMTFSCIIRFPPPPQFGRYCGPPVKAMFPSGFRRFSVVWDSSRPGMVKVQPCKLYFFASYEVGQKNTQAICSCSPLSHFNRHCGPTSQKGCTP